MRHVGRVVPVIVFSIGLIVGIRQLAVQNTAASEVVTTGAYVFGAVLILFAVLLGVGKGLGALVNRGRPGDDTDEGNRTEIGH